MISVVIATRNRAALLDGTLEAIAAQGYPRDAFEVVVIDNASTDDTRGVLAAAVRRLPITLRILEESRPGKSYALNTAVAHARGEILALTDDDVLPVPGWLSAYARVFEETDADFAVGRIHPLWEAPAPGWMSPALYGVLAVADGGDERKRLTGANSDDIMPIGANMAVRRQVVEQIGGWDPSLGKLQGTLRTGEDHEFALRMNEAGFTGIYEPAAAVHHRVAADRLRLSYFARWFFDNGAIEAGLDDRYAAGTPRILGVPRHLYRQAVGTAASLGSASLRGERRELVAHAMRLIWLAGYVRACWFDAAPAGGALAAGRPGIPEVM